MLTENLVVLLPQKETIDKHSVVNNHIPQKQCNFHGFEVKYFFIFKSYSNHIEISALCCNF